MTTTKTESTLSANHRDRPQWWTGPRLLKLGEQITFTFHLPEGTGAETLAIFPRYLEQADPAERFVPGGDLEWLDGLPSESIELAFENHHASVVYTPQRAGNYLARWRVGDEVLYRYFAAVEDDWIVLRFSTFGPLESKPSLHATGIPLDQRLTAAQFDPELPVFRRLADNVRYFGDALIPVLPDDPPTYTSSDEQRDALYALLLDRARALMPFDDDIRSARIDMFHDLDPGYTRSLAKLGIADHCGLNEANALYWLGMPEFPYFSSPIDCRKANQADGGDVVAHQWDFCGSFHFLGPLSWHYKAGEGDWPATEKCLRTGLAELAAAAAMSGHPAFAHPLYDGVVVEDYPNPTFECIVDETDLPPGTPPERAMSRFAHRYQQLMAFEAPKVHKVAYARSIDVADYYRRHFPVTPRTVFISRTDHIEYDKWWLCHWQNDGVPVTRLSIPWRTRISTILDRRQRERTFKDPLSCEFLLVEDQQRSIRFERECPNPIWWFDYSQQSADLRGSAITHTRTPDVEIIRRGWDRCEEGCILCLEMITDVSFPDYAIAIWEVPDGFNGDRASIRSNAKEVIVAWNAQNDYRLVLRFDLEPRAKIEVVISV